ncbi:MAG: hypothetical protein HN675_07900 [Opitutae bacterium]|nr:hypothetical protein [Opitutae bacterium]
MKRITCFTFTLLLLAIILKAEDLSKPRSWTSTAGTTLEASVEGIDLKAGTVKLKSTDGRALNIAIELLVQADRDLLKKWHDANTPEKPDAKETKKTGTKKPTKGSLDLSKPRKWTSTAGSQIEASVLGIDLNAGTVNLKTVDGRDLNIALRLLEQADRDLLKKWHTAKIAKEQGTGAVTKATADRLSVFSDGKWKGYNSIYEGPMYDAVLNTKGTLIIYPKDDKGERIGKHLTAALHCYYTEKNIGRHSHRKIVSIEESPKPVHSQRPIQVRLKGKFDDNVAFDVEFDCEDDKVSVEGGIKDPPGIKFPSRYHSRIHMPAIYNPGPDDNPDEIKGKFANYNISVRSDDGTEIHPYHIPLKSKKQVKDIRIKGPWGTKQLRIETPGIKNRETKETDYGTFWVYSSNPAYRGYYMMRSGTSGYRKGRVTLHLKDK